MLRATSVCTWEEHRHDLAELRARLPVPAAAGIRASDAGVRRRPRMGRPDPARRGGPRAAGSGGGRREDARRVCGTLPRRSSPAHLGPPGGARARSDGTGMASPGAARLAPTARGASPVPWRDSARSVRARPRLALALIAVLSVAAVSGGDGFDHRPGIEPAERWGP